MVPNCPGCSSKRVVKNGRIHIMGSRISNAEMQQTICKKSTTETDFTSNQNSRGQNK